MHLLVTAHVAGLNNASKMVTFHANTGAATLPSPRQLCLPQGGKSCWFSVMASTQVPVHITSLDKADAVYQKHAGGVLLGVRACGHMISLSCLNRCTNPCVLPSGSYGRA